jgi:hypothetical protein
MLLDQLIALSFCGMADAIFVFAGRESRKRFGVELFRRGVAPRLVLSVGRFEWRRFPDLGLSGDGGLTELVSRTPPEERHFFVDIGPEGAHCERVPVGPLGTWSESRALARFVVRESVRQLIVVSHRQHLYRCLLCLRLSLPPSCTFEAAPSPPDPREADSSRIWEPLKLLAYGLILAPPRLPGYLRSCLRG